MNDKQRSARRGGAEGEGRRKTEKTKKKMKSEGSTMLAAAVAFLAVTGGGDAHLNEPVYAPGVPPPKVNDGKLDKSDKSCILL